MLMIVTTTHQKRRTIGYSLAFVFAAVCFACADAADTLAPLEPVVAEASSEAEEAMAGIRIPEGWKIELFAAEPDVANVVAFDIDNQGRLFVCETFRQNQGVTDNRGHDETWLLADLAARTVQDRIDYHKRLLGEAAGTYAQHDDRIRMLLDTDGDHRVDQSTIVANGFNRLEEGTGAGVLVRGQNVYYTCIPKLWKLVDSNDDGVADERVVLSDGYGVRVAFRGHDMHGLLIGPDGRLYFTIGDRGYHIMTGDGRTLSNPAVGAVFRCELDGSGLEVYANGLRNPQELAFNDFGDLFTVDNNSDSGDQARIVQIVEGGDSGWRMYYQYLPDRGPFNRENIWKPFDQDQPAYIVPPITNFTDGPSGLAYYPGTGFGDELKDRFLICDFRGGSSNSGIRSFRLEPEGAFYKLADDAQPIWTALATDVAFGPDSALYVSDWVDGWNGLGKGRIYRITAPELADAEQVQAVQSLLGQDWEAAEVSDLKNSLGHPDRRIRLEAQWELARRGESSALLEVASRSDATSIARLHAIWGADQIARTQTESKAAILQQMRSLLSVEDPVLRSAVIQSIGERGDKESAEVIRQCLTHSSARVRYAATMALAKLEDASALPMVVGLLADNDNRDPIIRHAGIMYLAKAGTAEQVGELSGHANESVRRAAVVSLRRRSSGLITKFLKDPSPRVVLEAARAIHDAPLPVGLNALASLIAQDLEDPELTRRVLASNYRLGTAEAATAVAAFAANPASIEEMRLEALDMLAHWAAPDPRDRVINDYRPIAARAETIAAAAMDTSIDALMASKEKIRERATEVASGLGLKKIAPQLIQRITRASERPSSKAGALRSLADLDPQEAVKLARGIELDSPPLLVEAALSVLGKLDPQVSLMKFVQATQSSSMRIRQQAWDLIAKINDPRAAEAIQRAAAQYLEGTLAEDVHLNVIEAARARLDDETKNKIDGHQATLAKTDPLAPWLLSLQGGDIENGRRLFFEKTELSCVRCHQVERAGGAVGPNLTTIGKTRDRRYLLESICSPDAAIAEGFETAVVADEDGRVTTGIVKTETDDYLELIRNDGTIMRIETDMIVARRKGKSSMPADLTKYMTPRELRDLVAYLASRTSSERGSAEVE